MAKIIKTDVMNSRIEEGLFLASVEEDTNGNLLMNFDIDSDFKIKFAKREKLKRWSPKRFEKWILSRLENGLKLLEKKYDKANSK